MNSIPSGTTAIIFDLGGVIVDLSVSKTIQAFSDLSGWPAHRIMDAYSKHQEFFAYERGELSDVEFRAMLRRIFSLQVTDAQLDAAWNAMLLGVPLKKLELIEKLKSEVSVFVLSNTNNIHIQCVNSMFLNGRTLDDYFHKCYYSHEVGMRKPEIEIYRHVLQDAGLEPARTVFLDDNLENIQAASAVGIKAFHIAHPDYVFDLLT